MVADGGIIRDPQVTAVGWATPCGSWKGAAGCGRAPDDLPRSAQRRPTDSATPRLHDQITDGRISGNTGHCVSGIGESTDDKSGKIAVILGLFARIDREQTRIPLHTT
jgi:hypothetical protein